MSDDTPSDTGVQPRRIGVALSGGGYRAAAWGLGVMLYLVDAGVHRDVTTISSVSGGSITNAAFGLQPTRALTPESAWQLAAQLARRLAGNPRTFLAVLAVHAAAWLTMIIGAGLHDERIVVIAAIVAIAASILGAPGCGDAVFGRRIVWWYLDLVMAAVTLLAFVVGQGWWWLATVLLVGVLLVFRGTVVGWALATSLLHRDGRRSTLADLSTELDHVLCACDLHGRHHVYFGRDFVYSYGLGLGARPTLALGAALQASACLPGAFAPRAMRAREFQFTGGRYRAPLLALTDGGVYDNMADEWLLSFGDRAGRFEERAAAIEHPEKRDALQHIARRLAERAPTFLIVANASGPLGFRYAWTTFVPLIGEILSLLRVKSILYDNGHTTRRRLLVDDFITGQRSGVIVHISTDPWSVVHAGLKLNDQRTQARAHAVARQLETTPGLERDATRQPASAGTVLYPLQTGRIGNLLQRSYAIACAQAHIWHGLPLVDIPPLDWFAGLEAGLVLDRLRLEVSPTMSGA